MGPAETWGRQAPEGVDDLVAQPSLAGWLVPSLGPGFPNGPFTTGMRGWSAWAPRCGPQSERGRFMRSIARAVVKFLSAEDGPTAVEYAVMLALIVVVCITAITALGSNANKTFNNVALNTAVTGS
jgi:pilus assembly protein Flp/PilA